MERARTTHPFYPLSSAPPPEARKTPRQGTEHVFEVLSYNRPVFRKGPTRQHHPLDRSVRKRIP